MPVVYAERASLTDNAPRAVESQTDPVPARNRLAGPIALFVAILALGVSLRAVHLADPPITGDEAESAINALTILDTGLPRGEYLGLPIYENTLTEFWPEHPEYEFRDSSYSNKGVAIYHGWLPLYSIAGAFKLFGVEPDVPEPVIRVRRSIEEMHWRTIAARAPAVVFGALFMLFVFLTAREMCGADAAWAAMIIAAIGEPFVYFAREARYHSATLALSTGCCWIIWRMYKRRGWADFIAGGVLFAAMFHTHLVSFAVVCAAACLVLPAILLRKGCAAAWWKLLAMGGIVAALTLPWILLTGFLDQTAHIPPARKFLSYPADLLYYPLKKIPDGIPAILALIWVVFIELFRKRLPGRWTKPIREHRGPIYFLLAWVLIGFLAFTFMIPAASYFYKRLALPLVGPGLVFGAMLFALISREINARKSGWIASIAFVAIVIGTGKAYAPWWDDREPVGTYEAIDWLAKRELEPGTKIYCVPNDQFPLTFLAGVPVQSIAPVRKKFLDQYPGRIILIEASPPYQVLQAEDIVRLAGESGVTITRDEAQRLQSPLSTRLLRTELISRCASVGPALEPLLPFTEAAMRFQREYTEQRQRLWMANGANNPVLRGFDMPNFAVFWQIFFYRFVNPLSRSGENLNYANRIRSAHADVLPSGWAIFDCPPLKTDFNPAFHTSERNFQIP